MCPDHVIASHPPPAPGALLGLLIEEPTIPPAPPIAWDPGALLQVLVQILQSEVSNSEAQSQGLPAIRL